MLSSKRSFCALLLGAIITLASCNATDKAPSSPAKVDAMRLTAADSEPGQWMSHGRTYDEQRFSPLDKITTENVKELGLTWFAALAFRKVLARTSGH